MDSLDKRDKRLNIMFKFLWFFGSTLLLAIRYLFVYVPNTKEPISAISAISAIIALILFAISISLIYLLLIYILAESNSFSDINNENLYSSNEIEFLYIGVIKCLIKKHMMNL